MTAMGILNSIIACHLTQFPDSSRTHILLPATIYDGCDSEFRATQGISFEERDAQLATFLFEDEEGESTTYHLFRTKNSDKVSMYNQEEFNAYMRKMMYHFGV